MFILSLTVLYNTLIRELVAQNTSRPHDIVNRTVNSVPLWQLHQRRFGGDVIDEPGYVAGHTVMVWQPQLAENLHDQTTFPQHIAVSWFTMLDILPPELVVATLSYIPLQTLAVLCRAATVWHAFITSNESSIYRNAAFLHNFITHNDATLDLILNDHHGQLWNGVASWKEFCSYLSSRPTFVANSAFCSRVLRQTKVPVGEELARKRTLRSA